MGCRLDSQLAGRFGKHRDRARDLGAARGLRRDGREKDLGLYASNLEKLAQAVELMEETVAAERRKRGRQQNNEEPAPITGEGVPSAG